MESVMNDANTTPLLSQALEDELHPELEQPDNNKKAIESNNSTQSNKRKHPWLMPFLVNIFLAYASYSIVQPSLAPYLIQIGIPESYLPWTIFMYNIGGVFGSVMGLFYDYATRICKVEGRGAKISLLLCPLIGLVGSALYACAGWLDDVNVAKWLILIGRFLVGFWRSGQTSVEQAYLSTAVEPSVKTEYTAKLGTSAVLGTVMGPSVGALTSQILGQNDITIHGLPLDANNVPAFLIL
eukprot:scaffold248450_cov41-Cyclotella_meneghiniana.AAC.1